MKIEIKHWLSGAILFTHEAENNAIKITLEAGVKIKADLRGAHLGGAHLGGAYLGGAYLGGADLRGADLSGADLRGADLRGADLGRAYLSGADLRGADLRGAYLGGAYLGGAYLGGAYLGDKENPIEEIKQVGPIGSRSDYTVFFRLKKSFEVHCGCFRGSLDEFEKKVAEEYNIKEKHGMEYRALIKFIKTIWDVKRKGAA